ncbi:DUF4389 domain-containing protein [Actinomadura sp. ATCC 31491]|uniref:DUF4389 domain-containing protein n=1 Tax=Actinomadura luzonensis TaxID=2805427 RepID=A0ABT0FY97_9ACTN|nr:DUF4389 domain-containing protein [Actinomadura luzonensis]MCK2217328.1 DUF4389 domain-containing protein [Actinomadura luzonensis]
MNGYPVRVEARLDEPLNRGLWLVKWFLAIPHYIVLSLLWIAFAVLSVVAFFAILFTERYPRALFDFNLGVLRWTWRVAYYTYGALGTDRYPPFSLGAEPDYPATLEIDYPERLSRGLVLVKWWLLAIPHYLVVGLFTAGSVISWRDDVPDRVGGWFYTLDWGGLIGLMVALAAVALLFTGRYPHGVYDFVVGMNRWALRVAAYAALMTDAYPPFRLEQGGHELPRMEPPPVPHQEPVRHTTGSVVAIVLGALLAFAAIGTAAAGSFSAVVARSRAGDGFVSTTAERIATPSYALTTEEIAIGGQGVQYVRGFTGKVRISATGTATPLFVGVGPTADVDSYLRNVAYDRITRLTFGPGPEDVTYVRHPGGGPAAAPAAQPFWAAKGSGSVEWTLRPGDWTVVVMNADGGATISADLRLGATLPWLDSVTQGLFVVTGILLLTGTALVLIGVRLPHTPAPGPKPTVPTA